MRRKKKLLMNIIKILIVIIIAVGLFLIFKPKKQIDTTDNTSNNKELIKVTTVNELNIKADLPEEIKDSTTNTVIPKEEKTYEPSTQSSERYLIPILANNEVTILIGDDSAKLLNNNSKVQVGNEYIVEGTNETMKAVYYFTVDNYDYPILLLLGESHKLYFVDVENAYSTGVFKLDGYIKNIPDVENVYQTKVTEGDKTYPSAVIRCTNGEGYEFNIDMIGK